MITAEGGRGASERARDIYNICARAKPLDLLLAPEKNKVGSTSLLEGDGGC